MYNVFQPFLKIFQKFDGDFQVSLYTSHTRYLLYLTSHYNTLSVFHPGDRFNMHQVHILMDIWWNKWSIYQSANMIAKTDSFEISFFCTASNTDGNFLYKKAKLEKKWIKFEQVCLCH